MVIVNIFYLDIMSVLPLPTVPCFPTVRKVHSCTTMRLLEFDCGSSSVHKNDPKFLFFFVRIYFLSNKSACHAGRLGQQLAVAS